MPFSRAKILLILSGIALAKHLWFFVTWVAASNRGQTQAERVEIYLNQFPHSLLGVGAVALTWLLVALGIVGAALAFAARRTSGSPRWVATALLWSHLVFVLWYLFTLM